MVADEVRALAGDRRTKALRRSKDSAGEIQVDVRGVVGAVKKAAETSAIEAKAAAVKSWRPSKIAGRTCGELRKGARQC